MRVKKIVVTFTYDNGDNLKQVLSDKLYMWKEIGPDELIRESIKAVEDFRTSVRKNLCSEQLELPTEKNTEAEE